PATCSVSTVSLHAALPISQAGLAGAVGDGGHAAVVLVATAVEDDRVDAGGLGALGDQGADGAGLVRLRRLGAAEVRLHGGGRREDRKSTRLNSSHVKISYA